LTEIKGLEKRIIEKIKELLKISQDIEDKKIFNFIKECTYFPLIFTLASHYSKIYRNGLPLLGKITSSLIKDPTLEYYFQMRYDLNDRITRKQLNPLLEGKSPEEYPQIIEKWRNPYYTFKILSQKERERIETTEIDWDQVWDHIKSQTYGDKHYEQLFELEEFKNLEEENKNKIIEIIDVLFSSDKKTINFGELREILQEKLNEKKINILIGYFQLLRDISLKQKTPKEILNKIERLNKNIQQNWQEFGQLVMWQQDIYNYLTQLIKEQEKERKIIRKQTILLSYLTDHPKILFEIGKYPVSTCQDYESTGDLNKKLLGYVFDAHIKALVLREIEIETEEEINEEDLNQAKVEIDEEKGTIIITLPNGKTFEGRISKPIARRIIMLGKKERKATLLLEPIYSRRGRGDKTYKEILAAPLEKIRRELNLEITESGKGIDLPGSHNPAGYYRDI
jgi:ferritin